MRFMLIYKPGRDADLSAPPSPKEMSEYVALGELTGKMIRSGVIVDTGGLAGSERGARVRMSGEDVTVTDGPFEETRELIAGYAIVEAKSKAEAVEFAKRFLKVAGGGESEVREMYQAPTLAGRSG